MVCLLAAPAVLVTIELFHPAGFTAHPGDAQYLSKPEPYNPQMKRWATSARSGGSRFT